MTLLKEIYGHMGLRQCARNFKSVISVFLCAVDCVTRHAATPELAR